MASLLPVSGHLLRNACKLVTSQSRTLINPRAATKAKYGGRFMVTMLPGDGIGPEMMGYVRTVFK